MPNHWAGGNVNKLLSIVATKLSFLELREQENRADSTDIARSITTYLISCQDYSANYLKEGVRRIAQTWVESRKIHKDIDPSQFQTAWDSIKISGFQHAMDSLAEMATKATLNNLPQDSLQLNNNITKFGDVLANPTEQLQQY